MATAWETFPIYFKGGLRTDLGRLEQGLQAPGSAIVLKNFEPSVEGGYAKIKGYEKFSDTEVSGSGPITFVAALDESSALARRGDTYYYSTGGAWTSKLTATTTGATKVRYARFNFDGTEKLVVVDGKEDPAFFFTSSNTMSYDTNAPSDVTGASGVIIFKNHIFFAKNNLLSFTAPYTTGDYNTGNGAGVINVGDEVVGLKVFRERLIIFGRSSIKYLGGNTSSDFTLQPIADNTGCLCGDTIQEVGGDLMYLGPDGVRWLSATERNNDFGLEKASSNIQSEISKVIGTGCSMSSIVVRSKNQYRIFFYDGAVATTFSKGFLATIFGQQAQERIEWAQLSGMQVYCADNLQFDNNEIILFGNSTGYVYRMESSSSFDGKSILSTYQTPYMPINDPRFRKTLYRHSLYSKISGNFSTTFEIKYDYDEPGVIQPGVYHLNSSNAGTNFVYGDGASVYGQATYSKPLRTEFVTNVTGSGLVVSIRYDNVGNDPQFFLNYAILEYRTNERR